MIGKNFCFRYNWNFNILIYFTDTVTPGGFGRRIEGPTQINIGRRVERSTFSDIFESLSKGTTLSETIKRALDNGSVVVHFKYILIQSKN